MPTDLFQSTVPARARGWALAHLALLALSAAVFLLACAAPVASSPGVTATPSPKPVPTLNASPPALDPLLSRLSGRRLIRAAEVQAAVKDSGVAQRLLAHLKLQGIVQIQGAYVAYVQVDDTGVRAVRANDSLLDFLVESVEPGVVKLSLEGVHVNLAY